MVCYDRTILAEIQLLENLESEGAKTPLKMSKRKFLAIILLIKKLSFDIFTVGNLKNIFMEQNMIFT